MDLLEIALKLLLAVALGGLIGLEREARQKPAGFRTNILVCVGSAMLMAMAGALIKSQGGSGDSLIRMAAGVVTGIGFLGAGSIIQARGMVAGLTTASTIWLVAGLGLVIGAGFYVPSLIFAGTIIVTLLAFGRVEDAYLHRSVFHYHVKIAESPETLSRLRKLSFHHGLKLERLNLHREGRFHVLTFSFSAGEEKEQEFNQGLLSLGEIEELKID